MPCDSPDCASLHPGYGARPSFEQLLDPPIEAREILAAHAVRDRLLQQRGGERAVERRRAHLLGEAGRHAEILGEVRHRGAAVERAREDVLRKPHLGDEAAGVAGVEDLDGLLEVDAGALGDAAALARGEEDRVQHHVVDELQAVPGAARPDMEDAARDLLQDRARALDRRLVAADHQRQRAGIRAGRAAGHAAIDIGAAGLGRECGEPLRVGRMRGREVDQDLPVVARREQAIGAGQARLDLRRGRHDEQNTFARLRRSRTAAGGRRPADKPLRPNASRIDIERRAQQAGAIEVRGDAPAHLAEPDDADRQRIAAISPSSVMPGLAPRLVAGSPTGRLSGQTQSLPGS